jgi:hypothetical protein
MADEPFVDQAPVAPQSWNLYSYVRNSPAVYNDPERRDRRVCDTASEFGANLEAQGFTKSTLGSHSVHERGISNTPFTRYQNPREDPQPKSKLMAW